MTYTVRLLFDEEEKTFAVWCPALPGCWSQGTTEDQALQNIREAIADYLSVQKGNEPPQGSYERVVQVEKVA
ncbi:MAG: type II toxin-antitoxin system HicB family antitoxin [Chlorobia bacterium]|nr:type II toxin-antitoxin system HicB family antitoxin [Fimbriimonadaceae bacterium]